MTSRANCLETQRGRSQPPPSPQPEVKVRAQKTGVFQLSPTTFAKFQGKGEDPRGPRKGAFLLLQGFLASAPPSRVERSAERRHFGEPSPGSHSPPKTVSRAERSSCGTAPSQGSLRGRRRKEGWGEPRGCSRQGRKVSLAPRPWPPGVATAKTGASPLDGRASGTRLTRARELGAWRRIAVWMLRRPGGPKALGLGTAKTTF